MERVNEIHMPRGSYRTTEKAKARKIGKVKEFWQKYWLPTLMLVPAGILYLMFFIYPTLNSFYLSFNDWNILTGAISFEGLSNYKEVLTDPVFYQSVKNMAVYVIFATIPLILLSLFIAIAIENCGKAKGFFRTAIYIPVIISMSVSGMMWQFILSPTTGIVNQVMTILGFEPISWLTDVRTARGVIIVVGICRGLGTNVVLFIAGLKGISKEQIEAAKVDGANRFQIFRHITLPSISYVTSFVTITTIISCFQIFTTIQVMTMGGPNNATNMPVFQLWQEAFQFFDMGRATSISTMMFIVILGLSMLVMRKMEKANS